MEVLWFFRMRGADAPPLSERSLKMPARRCTTGPSSAITLPQFLENKDVMWTDVKWSWLVSFRICFHDFYMVCIVYICVYTLHTYMFCDVKCEAALLHSAELFLSWSLCDSWWLWEEWHGVAVCKGVCWKPGIAVPGAGSHHFTSFHHLTRAGLVGDIWRITKPAFLSCFRLFRLHLKVWNVDWETTIKQRE